MPEVGTVVEQYETEESVFVDVQSPDFIGALLAAEKEKKAIENGDIEMPAERRERTLAALEVYFGDRIIHYGKYKGTYMDIIHLCPAADHYVNQGPEAFIAWVEAGETEPDTPDDVTNEDENKKGEEDTPPNDDEGDKKADGEKTKADAERVKDKAKAVTGDTAKQEAVQKESVAKEKGDTNIATPLVVEKPKPSKVLKQASSLRPDSVQPLVTKVVDESKPAKDIIAAPVEEKSASQEISPSLKTQEVDVAQVDLKMDTLQEVATPTSEVPKQPDAHVQGEVVVGTETETEPNLEVYRSIETNDSTPTDLLDEVLLNESPVRDEKALITEQFETWREVADDEPALDEFFITITEQLDAAQNLERVDEDDGREDVEDTEDTLEIESEAEILDIEQAFAHFQAAELANDTEGEALFDAHLIAEATPKRAALYGAMKSARKSVEKLYTAKTKEECAAYIHEITSELTEILRALGYENPERVVHHFMSRHSIETLRNLIGELEQSLRQAMHREVVLKQRHHAQNRQTRVGKFVSYIMQAVTSKLFAAQTN